jgi:hypothetical protein
MTLEYEFDDKVRFLVIYQTVTKKASSIQHYTGIKIRTIYDWIKKLKKISIFWHINRVRVGNLKLLLTLKGIFERQQGASHSGPLLDG